MNIDEARIVLTGAAGGIGSATAALLARAGAKLRAVAKYPSGTQQ